MTPDPRSVCLLSSTQFVEPPQKKFLGTPLGHLAGIAEKRGAYRVQRLLGRPSHKWEDCMKMDLEKVGWVAQTGLNWLRIRTGGVLL